MTFHSYWLLLLVLSTSRSIDELKNSKVPVAFLLTNGSLSGTNPTVGETSKSVGEGTQAISETT